MILFSETSKFCSHPDPDDGTAVDPKSPADPAGGDETDDNND